MSKRIAIVEDDSGLRRSLVSLFTAHEDFEYCTACASGEEFLEYLALQPTEEMLVLVDLGRPGITGQQLIDQLSKSYPQLTCVAHTVFEEKEAVFSALRAGAAGYLLKGLAGPSLLRRQAALREAVSPRTATGRRHGPPQRVAVNHFLRRARAH